MKITMPTVSLGATSLALLFVIACSSGEGETAPTAPSPQANAPASDAPPPAASTAGAAGTVTVTVPNQGGRGGRGAIMEGHTPRGFRGSGTGLFVGDNLNPNFPEGDGVQAFLTFDLADVPQGQVVAAVLRSNHASTRGSPYRDLGPLTAEEIRYDAFSPDLWNLPPLAGGTGCLLATSAAAGVECGVRDAVQRSLDDGRSNVQFRIRFDRAGDGDGSPDLAMFFITNSNTNEPGVFELEITVDSADELERGAAPADRPGLRNGLVAHYRFNGDAADASGNGNDGRVAGAQAVPDLAGGQNGALAFDGIDDVIEVAHSDSLDLSREVTMSFWLLYERQPTQAFYTIFEKSDPGDGHARYGFWLIGDQVEVCADPSSGGAQRCLDSTLALLPGTWNHVVGRYDGQRLDITLNGEPAGQRSYQDAGISRNNAPLFIGADLFNPALVYTKQTLDELRIYNRALTDEEIQELFNAGPG